MLNNASGLNQHSVHRHSDMTGLNQMNVNKFAGQIVSSSIASTCGIMLGHPLETVKVRLQTQRISGFSGALPQTARQCARQLIQREGARGLWKGMTQQFLAAVPAMSVMFFVMDKTKTTLKSHSIGSNMDNVSLGMYSGAVAGAARVFILVPFDLLKTRAQAQKNGKIRYSQMISTLYRQQGLAGLYRGFWTVALRDVPACAAYFYTFEKLKQLGERNNYWTSGENDEQDSQWSKTLWTMNSGGMAGVASWVVAAPQDMIKTRQQSHMGSKTLSIPQTVRMMRADSSLGQILKPLPVTLARGYIVSLVALPMYEYLKGVSDEL